MLKGLYIYFMLCSFVTSVFIVIYRIKNRLTRRTFKDDKDNAELEHCLVALRQLAPGMSDDAILFACVLFVTYFPGFNFLLWKSLFLGLFGIE